MTFREPSISIDGQVLTEVEASVVRCAIAVLLTDLSENEMAEEMGQELAQNYRDHCVEIERLMGVRPK
jgi:hypothetical protein